ncbi:MAG: lysylphosphatidylglycerol synthase transmembrane domain-containing protein [Deltaproteobacteria bacterium]|nr:lysylphosphatidylglycerol synthase transmembrane domain-containing protein [Deltaproteobacteria bacterium]
MRKALQLIVGIAVSAACLYLATRGTDWPAVRGALAGADPRWAALVLLVAAVNLTVRSARWVQLLRPLGAARFAAALSATAVGNAATAVLPLRLGELVRPALLARRCALRMAPVLATVVVERLFDLLFILLSFFALSLLYPLPAAVSAGARGLAAAGTGGMAALVVAQYWRPTVDGWLRALLGRLPAWLGERLAAIAFGLLDGCRGLADPRTVLRVSALSALQWALVSLLFLCCLLALGIAAPLLPAALATTVLVAAFVFLPQAPGFVGTWQAGCVVALDLFDVPRDLAVSYSLLSWLLAMLFNVGVGGLFLVGARRARPEDRRGPQSR